MFHYLPPNWCCQARNIFLNQTIFYSNIPRQTITASSWHCLHIFFEYCECRCIDQYLLFKLQNCFCHPQPWQDWAGLGRTELGGNMRNYLSCYLVLIRLLILWAGWYWWSLTLIHALQETMHTSITLHLTLRISQMWLLIVRLIFNIQKILWRQPQKIFSENYHLF